MASDSSMTGVQSTSKRHRTSNSSASEDNPGPRKHLKSISGSAAPANAIQSESIPTHFVDISDELKTRTLRYMLEKIIADPSTVSASALVTLACEHRFQCMKRPLLMAALQSHHCSWACLIHYTDAREAGQLDDSISIDDISPPFNRQLISVAHSPAVCMNLSCKQTFSRCLLDLEVEQDKCAIHWLRVETDDFHNEIM
ncbi:hypothetical protein B0H10DRAFT_1899328 [Mycena sp. CBHHK59/15]|nr:hypothetical protein B0H10DRAFT_1899328 [Mycena sp. CBHHK59/15]